MTDCPPPLVSMETIALPNEDGSVFVVSTAETETRQLAASYDMRIDTTQATVKGELEMTNTSTRRALIRYRWSRSIASDLRPALSVDLPVCYDWAASTLVVLIETKVLSGDTETTPLDWTVPLYWHADLNQDGTVDGVDRGLLLADYNTDSQRSDLNRDGVVDGSDLGVLFAYWGRAR